MASVKDEKRSVIVPICILKLLVKLSVSHMFWASRVTYLSSHLPPPWGTSSPGMPRVSIKALPYLLLILF